MEGSYILYQNIIKLASGPVANNYFPLKFLALGLHSPHCSQKHCLPSSYQNDPLNSVWSVKLLP